MGIPVIIYGKSGTGKSRSLKNFKEDELFLVNVIGKPLPFKGSFKYSIATDDLKTIMAGLSKMSEQGIKAAVVDDFGYIMTNQFMREFGKGNNYDLFSEIARKVWTFVDFVGSSAVAPDAVVYLIMHEETADNGSTKLLTIGKLLDQKACLEGMCTVVLHSAIKGERYVFETQNNGSNIAKSPEGMFGGNEIPNDLKAVDEAVRAYWGFDKKGGK